jgi:hypothetical protein
MRRVLVLLLILYVNLIVSQSNLIAAYYDYSDDELEFSYTVGQYLNVAQSTTSSTDSISLIIGIDVPHEIIDNEEYLEPSGIKLSLYPNPTRNETQIKYIVPLDPEVKELKVVIYNLKGNKLMDFELIDFDQKIDVSNYPVGIYFVKLIIDGKFYKILKLVKY